MILSFVYSLFIGICACSCVFAFVMQFFSQKFFKRGDMDASDNCELMSLAGACTTIVCAIAILVIFSIELIVSAIVGN